MDIIRIASKTEPMDLFTATKNLLDELGKWSPSRPVRVSLKPNGIELQGSTEPVINYQLHDLHSRNGALFVCVGRLLTATSIDDLYSILKAIFLKPLAQSELNKIVMRTLYGYDLQKHLNLARRAHILALVAQQPLTLTEVENIGTFDVCAAAESEIASWKDPDRLSFKAVLDQRHTR